MQASGQSVTPFGLENENRILAGVNALGLTSQYTSYWRFKSIIEDTSRSSVTINMVCIRQPDRHGKMGSVVSRPHHVLLHWQSAACCCTQRNQPITDG